MTMFVVLKQVRVQKALSGHACLKRSENAPKKAEIGVLIIYKREIKIGRKVIFLDILNITLSGSIVC